MNKTLRTKSSSINIISFVVIIVLFVFSLSGCQQGNDMVNGNKAANTNTATNSNASANTNANSNVTANSNANANTSSVVPSNTNNQASNTATAKATDSPSTKGCQPTTAVNFKKGTFGQTFKCQMSGKNGQHKYTLYAKAGQMFNIQFETNGAGTAPYAVYKIVNPDGVLKREDEEGNSETQLDKTGKWTVTVDLSSSATNPSAEYTITFTIGGRDGS